MEHSHAATSRFDRERNVYVCLMDKLLTTTGNVGSDHIVRYRAFKRDCRACPLKPQCCPNTPSRKVIRDVNEDARDHACSFISTPEFGRSRDERKKVEMRFAHLKTHHRLSVAWQFPSDIAKVLSAFRASGGKRWRNQRWLRRGRRCPT